MRTAATLRVVASREKIYAITPRDVHVHVVRTSRTRSRSTQTSRRSTCLSTFCYRDVCIPGTFVCLILSIYMPYCRTYAYRYAYRTDAYTSRMLPSSCSLSVRAVRYRSRGHGSEMSAACNVTKSFARRGRARGQFHRGHVRGVARF